MKRFLIRILLSVTLLLLVLPQPCRGTTRERFVLTFVGDCTFGGLPSTYNAQVGFVKTVGEDYGYPFRQVICYFTEDEATFLNLEGPLCDKEQAVTKKFVFRGPERFGSILTENSVEAVSVANNHTMDQGRQGYDATLAVLEKLDIPCAQQNQGTLFTTKNGLTIGIYGAVYTDLDPQQIVAGIQELAAQEPDLLIFAPHWGVEGSFYPTQAQTELAHRVIEAGADIVWGSHPHVLQPVETYRDGVIYYSLGNFSFGGNGDPRDYDTALIQQEVFREADGTVTLGETILIPCCISGTTAWNDFQPVPYAPDSEGFGRVMEKLQGTWPITHIPIT